MSTPVDGSDGQRQIAPRTEVVVENFLYLWHLVQPLGHTLIGGFFDVSVIPQRVAGDGVQGFAPDGVKGKREPSRVRAAVADLGRRRMSRRAGHRREPTLATEQAAGFLIAALSRVREVLRAGETSP